MTDFWSLVRACLICVNFMSSSQMLEGKKGPFLFVPSTLTPSEAGKMLILSPLLPSLSEFTFLRECLQCVFLLGQNFYQVGKCMWFLSTSVMSTEVSVAVKTEGRNHKPGALQRVVRGGGVKLSVHTHTETTPLELVYVKVFTQPWRLELPSC